MLNSVREGKLCIQPGCTQLKKLILYRILLVLEGSGKYTYAYIQVKQGL